MDEKLTRLLNLPEVAVEYWCYSQNFICFTLSIVAKVIQCQYCCQHTAELHQIRPIIIKDLPAFGKEVYLKLPRRQFYCRFCQRYITEKLEFIDWRRQYTKRYEQHIYRQVINSSLEQVSQQENLSVEQIKNIVTHVIQKHNSRIILK